jgi:chitinase
LYAEIFHSSAGYGRSFTLKDGSCNTPNGVCQFSGGANAGPCSAASGILDLQEIEDIISNNNLKPVHDEEAGVKWITWDNNQWVSYDDTDTFKQKRDFANSRCLGGLMVWAMDQRDQSKDNGLGAANGVTNEQQSDLNQMSSDSLASNVACYTSDCGDDCKKGTFQVTQMSGQPGQVSTADRCPKGKFRSLCCSDGSTLGKCQWRGWRGAGLSCMGGCADGETELARNTNHHDKKEDQTCNGGLQSYCCGSFHAGPTLSQLAQDAKDAAEDAAEALAEQAALDVAAKAFCRVAVPALLAPLELLEDLIPIVGEILDIAEIAATPALIQACVKGVEKEGKAEFKVFGKEHTLSWDKPTQKPTSRKPESTHTSASIKSESSCKLNKRAPDLKTETIERRIETDAYNAPIIRNCNFGLYPQACWHYASVIANERIFANSELTCTQKNLRAPRPLPAIYSPGQHDGGWITGWMQQFGVNCERDEFPPAIIWQGRDGPSAPNVWIRFLPQTQNGGAGQLFNGICDDNPPVSTLSRRMVDSGQQNCRPWESWTSTAATHYNVLSLDFQGMNHPPADPWGLTANPCWPNRLVNDPGFALMTEDPYYPRGGAVSLFAHRSYPSPPSANIVGNNVPQPGFNKEKRDSGLDPDEIVLMDQNSTRKITDEELYRHFGILRCKDEDCSTEKEAHGIESALNLLPAKTTIKTTQAEATAVAHPSAISVGDEAPSAAPGSRMLTTPDFPLTTGLP